MKRIFIGSTIALLASGVLIYGYILDTIYPQPSDPGWLSYVIFGLFWYGISAWLIYSGCKKVSRKKEGDKNGKIKATTAINQKKV